jgi:hypothetical protein
VVVEKYILKLAKLMNYSKMVVSLEAKWRTILKKGKYVCRIGKWVGLFKE